MPQNRPYSPIFASQRLPKLSNRRRPLQPPPFSLSSVSDGDTVQDSLSSFSCLTSNNNSNTRTSHNPHRNELSCCVIKNCEEIHKSDFDGSSNQHERLRQRHGESLETIDRHTDDVVESPDFSQNSIFCNRKSERKRLPVNDSSFLFPSLKTINLTRRRSAFVLYLILLLPITSIIHFVVATPASSAGAAAAASAAAQQLQQQPRQQRQQRQQQQNQYQQQQPQRQQAGSGPNIQLEYAGGKYLEPNGDQFHLICLSSAPLKEWLRNEVSLYVAPPEMLRTMRQQNVWTDMTSDKSYTIRVERNMQNHAVSPYKSTLTSGTRLDGIQFGGNYTCVTGDRSGNIAQHMTHHVNVLNQWNAVEAEALRYVSDTEELQLPPGNTATLPNGDVVMVLDREPGQLDHDIELKCDCQLNPCPGNISWAHFDRRLHNGDWYSPEDYQRLMSQNQQNENMRYGNDNRPTTTTEPSATASDERKIVRVLQKDDGVSKLIIPIFHFDDLGVYKCQLDTSDVSRTQQSITRAVTIYMPPVVNIVTPPNILRGDENVSIVCEVSGYPKPNVRWHVYDLHNDTVLDPQSIELVLPNITINTTDRGWRYPESSKPWVISTILIRKATDEHNRKLVCVADNIIPLIRDREAYAPQVQTQQRARTLRIKDPNNYILPAAIIAGELVAVTLCIWCCGRCDIDESSSAASGRPAASTISRTPHGKTAVDGTAGELRPLHNSTEVEEPSNNNNRPVVRHTGPGPNTHEYIFVPDERGGEVRPASSSSLHHQDDQSSSHHHRAHA